jgi:hypothetical protein
LDLDDQMLGLVLDPGDLETLAVQGAVEDLAAVVVRHQRTAAGAPQRLPAIGKPGTGAVQRRHEIGRPAIDRNLEDGRGEPRSLDDRLIVAGEEARAVAQLGDAQRTEVALEEQPCLLVRQALAGDGAAAHVPQREIHRSRLVARRGGAHQRPAARQQGRKGRRVII